MTRVFLGLGSNKGDRLNFLRRAVEELSAVNGLNLRRVSGVYETEPFGVKEQDDFLNAAVELETTLAPEQCGEILRKIERSVGQKAVARWGPREIDIDVLFFGDTKLKSASLTLPHPGVPNRRFVLVPLAEIAPEFRDPESGFTVSELLARCTDAGLVKTTSMTIR